MSGYLRMPCDSLVKREDAEEHREECEACKGGWSVFGRPENEERKLDDPRHGQAASINRERYRP